MDLKKISIENFKCFGNRVDIDFGRLTLLTGANSSGKTSVIYSILGALQSGEFPFQFSPNGKYVNMGDFKDIVYNHDKKGKIKLGFTFEGTSNQKIETVWEEDAKNNLLKLFELNVNADYFSLLVKSYRNKYLLNFTYERDIYPNHEALHNFILKDIRTDEPQTTQTIKDLEIEKLPINYNITDNANGYVLDQTLHFISTLFTNYDNQINFLSPFRLSPEKTYYEQSKTKLKISSTGEGYLDQIIYWETNKNPKLKQLIANLKKIKLLHSIKARRVGGGKYEILVKVKKDGAETSLSEVGARVAQFLPTMVADLQLPDDSTLFVAEPESHLHPNAQSLFGDYLTNQIKSTPKNYVIETHSEYLLNKIRLAIVKGDLKEEDVKVLFLDNDGDKNVIHNITFKPQGQIMNAPKNFFKTYMIDIMDIALNSVK